MLFGLAPTRAQIASTAIRIASAATGSRPSPSAASATTYFNLG